MIDDNYFLRPYVCTSCADSKRSVSDRWLINDKVKALAEINPQEPLIFPFFDTPFFSLVRFFSILYIYSRINLRYSFEMPSRCVYIALSMLE